MAAVLNAISISEQCEHLHTVLYNPFLLVPVPVPVPASLNAPLGFIHIGAKTKAKVTSFTGGFIENPI